MTTHTDPTAASLAAEAHVDFTKSMTYGDYLHLDTLLSAQKPLTKQHDEMLFIVIHHSTELWMKLVLHELEAARAMVMRDELQPAFKGTARVSRIQALLIQSWDILATMTPADYLKFRDDLGQSSGFQSMQYRLIEFLLGNKQAHMISPHKHRADMTATLQRALETPSLYDETIKLLARRGFAIAPQVLERDVTKPYTGDPSVLAAWVEIYRDPKTHWELYQLAEELVDLEDSFQQWRFRHVTTVQRIIGFRRGTGGTAGVGYLKKVLDTVFFPNSGCEDGPMTLPTSSFFDAERTREELDIDYAPSRFVPSLPAVIQDWGRRTKEAKAAHAGRFLTEVSYGSHPRETIDLYRADSTSAPLLVFIHGGFWQAVSKEESGFVAGAWTKRGVHVAVLDYVLAPEVTLPTIVAQARKGLATLVAQADALGIDASRIVVSGHSAGGHLSAMSQIAHDAPVVPVAGLVLVSGVFELEPIRKSYVNDKVAMSAADAAALSPARFPPAHPLPLLVVVGEKEPTAFQEQSRLMAWNWKAQGCSTQMMLVPRRTHFDILDDLALPESALGAQTARLLKLA